MKKSEFLKDVEHEVKMLKVNATAKELARLDFDKFDASEREACIYGQMTGHCNSRRSKELMDKSCIRVLDTRKKLKTRTILDNDKTFSEIKHFVNGKYEGQGWEYGFDPHSFEERDMYYLSALEGYIGLKGSNVEHIFDYLTGKIDIFEIEIKQLLIMYHSKWK